MILHNIVISNVDYDNKKGLLFDFRDKDHQWRNRIHFTPGQTTMQEVIEAMRDFADICERRLQYAIQNEKG